MSQEYFINLRAKTRDLSKEKNEIKFFSVNFYKYYFYKLYIEFMNQKATIGGGPRSDSPPQSH